MHTSVNALGTTFILIADNEIKPRCSKLWLQIGTNIPVTD